MKKIVLSLVALAFTAMAMVSCGDDSNDTGTSQSEETKVTSREVVFAVVVSSTQLQYFDQTYTLDIDGTTKTIKASDMAVNKDSLTTYSLLASEGKAFCDSYQVRTVSLGNVTIGKTVKVTNETWTLKSSHPTQAFNFIQSCAFYYSGGHSSIDAFYSGFDADETTDDNIKKFLSSNISTKNNSLTVN